MLFCQSMRSAAELQRKHGMDQRGHPTSPMRRLNCRSEMDTSSPPGPQLSLLPELPGLAALLGSCPCSPG